MPAAHDRWPAGKRLHLAGCAGRAVHAGAMRVGVICMVCHVARCVGDVHVSKRGRRKRAAPDGSAGSSSMHTSLLPTSPAWCAGRTHVPARSNMGHAPHAPHTWPVGCAQAHAYPSRRAGGVPDTPDLQRI